MMGCVMWGIPMRFIPCYVLCEFYNFMEFIYMYTYTTAELQAAGFVEEVRGIFTPQKTEYAKLP